MEDKADSAAPGAHNRNGNGLPIEMACLILSAACGDDADISYVTRRDAAGVHYQTVSVDLAEWKLVIGIHPAAVGEATAHSLGSLLVRRVREGAAMATHVQEGVARCASHLKMAVQRADAGLRLESVQMAPHPVEEVLTQAGIAFQARVAGLNDRLQEMTATITGDDGREMVGYLEKIVQSQRRRWRNLVRFQANDAAFEMDAVAEAAVGICGSSVLEVAQRLFTGEPAVRLVKVGIGGPTAELVASLQNGRLTVSGNVAAGGRTGTLDGDLLRLDGPVAAGRSPPPKGSSPHDVLPHPIFAEGAKISAARPGASGGMELTLLIRRRLVSPAEIGVFPGRSPIGPEKPTGDGR